MVLYDKCQSGGEAEGAKASSKMGLLEKRTEREIDNLFQ